MYIIEKTFKIPMGHRLSHHLGLCKNVHGHNFVIKVGVSSKELRSNGMIIDFTDLKNIVMGVIDPFDHAMVINGNESMEIRERFKEWRLLMIDGEPTAENLCKFFYDAINTLLCDTPLTLCYVKIWENEDSMAMYRKDLKGD